MVSTLWLSRFWRDLSTDFADFTDFSKQNLRNLQHRTRRVNLWKDFCSFPFKTEEPTLFDRFIHRLLSKGDGTR